MPNLSSLLFGGGGGVLGAAPPGGASDFATELAQESGRLRELPRLGAVAALPQARFLGSGLQATPFVGTPSGEPIGELPNARVCKLACGRLSSELEFGRMGRAPGAGLGGRLLVVELRLGGHRRRGLYSDSNGISVPESLIFFIAYNTAASHRAVRGPCDETRLPLSDVDLAHLTSVDCDDLVLTITGEIDTDGIVKKLKELGTVDIVV
ncbi:hypothetical protein BHE74_00053672 [Ensete ventricosum]|nr:hypothetical protein BHE74_00053672 [Ensete ventricosum]